MEKKTNNPAITKSYAKKMETISPFELKNKLIDMAGLFVFFSIMIFI